MSKKVFAPRKSGHPVSQIIQNSLVMTGKIVDPFCIFKTNSHGFVILLGPNIIGLNSYRLPKLPGSVDDESTYTDNALF
jgi:hypothetical protein